jgi:hypothetical protein
MELPSIDRQRDDCDRLRREPELPTPLEEVKKLLGLEKQATMSGISMTVRRLQSTLG